MEIEAYFVPEINFSIVFQDDEGQPLKVFYGSFAQTIAYPSFYQYGYVMDGWKVAPIAENNIFAGTSLAPNKKFSYTLMPDLSPNREEDGSHIYLEPILRPVEDIVTLKPNNGTPNSAVHVFYNQPYSFYTPTKYGYIFGGWIDASGKNYGTSGTWDKVTASDILNAKWTSEVYNIYYHVNAGTMVDDSPRTYTIETPTITLPNASKSGYRFMGWYTNANLTGNRVYSMPKGSTGDKNFYPDFRQIYYINFAANGGSSVAGVEYIFGEPVLLPKSIRGGYKGNWIIGSSYYAFNTSFTNTDTTKLTITATASWTVKTIEECYNPATDYYEIYFRSQLNGIRTQYETDHYGSTYYYKNYKLMATIDLGGDVWIPLPYIYQGTFEGNFSYLKNFKLQANKNGSFGFFECNAGTIQNLLFSSITVTGTHENPEKGQMHAVGIVAGMNMGVIRRCDIYNSSINIPSYYHTVVGAIAGANSMGSIDACSNYNTNITGWGDLGGIIGINMLNGNITNSYANCTIIYDLHNSYSNVGGIVGKNENYCTVSANTFNGFISWDSPFRNRLWVPSLAYIIGRNEGKQYSNVKGSSANHHITYYYNNFIVVFDQSERCFKVDGGKVGSQTSTATNARSATLSMPEEDSYFVDLIVYEDAIFAVSSGKRCDFN